MAPIRFNRAKEGEALLIECWEVTGSGWWRRLNWLSINVEILNYRCWVSCPALVISSCILVFHYFLGGTTTNCCKIDWVDEEFQSNRKLIRESLPMICNATDATSGCHVYYNYETEKNNLFCHLITITLMRVSHLPFLFPSSGSPTLLMPKRNPFASHLPPSSFQSKM